MGMFCRFSSLESILTFEEDTVFLNEIDQTGKDDFFKQFPYDMEQRDRSVVAS